MPFGLDRTGGPRDSDTGVEYGLDGAINGFLYRSQEPFLNQSGQEVKRSEKGIYYFVDEPDIRQLMLTSYLIPNFEDIAKRNDAIIRMDIVLNQACRMAVELQYVSKAMEGLGFPRKEYSENKLVNSQTNIENLI